MQVAGESRSSDREETGGWVSKAQATCLEDGDNLAKAGLIPDDVAASHGAAIKGFGHLQMGLRAISWLVG